MEETPPITTGNAVGDSEIDSDEDVILSSASDTGDDESTIRTDDDYAYANDAAAEEDYSETQQNTDTEAASSDTDEERFREMHDQHAAEEKRLLELYHQQQAARRSQGSPDLSADANEALTTLSSLVNDNATPDASLLQGLTPSNARDRIEEMLRGSSNVQATGRTLQEEVAAIGASLLPRIQESDLNQSSHSESHFSETRQSGQPDGRSSSVHHSSQHGTQSGADGNDQQSPRQLVGLDSIFDRAAHGSSAGGGSSQQQGSGSVAADNASQARKSAGVQLGTAQDKTSDTASRAAEGASDAGKAAGSHVQGAGDKTSEAASGAVDNASHASKRAGEQLESGRGKTSRASSEAADRASDASRSAADESSQAASGAADSASNVSKRAGEQLESGKDKASRAASGAAEGAADTDRSANDQLESAKDKTSEAASGAAESASDVGKSAGGQLEAAKDKTSEAASGVGESASDAGKSAGGQLEAAKDKTSEAASGAAQGASSAAKSAGGQAESAAQKASGAASDAAQGTSDAVKSAGSQLGSALQQGSDSAADSSKDISGTASQAKPEASQGGADASTKSEAKPSHVEASHGAKGASAAATPAQSTVSGTKPDNADASQTAEGAPEASTPDSAAQEPKAVGQQAGAAQSSKDQEGKSAPEQSKATPSTQGASGAGEGASEAATPAQATAAGPKADGPASSHAAEGAGEASTPQAPADSRAGSQQPQASSAGATDTGAVEGTSQMGSAPQPSSATEIGSDAAQAAAATPAPEGITPEASQPMAAPIATTLAAADAKASSDAPKASGSEGAQSAAGKAETPGAQKPSGLGGAGAKPGGSRMPFLPPRPSRGPKPSQPKPAQPAEGASQDRAQVPSDEPEVSQPTHQQPSASTAQPSAAAQRQPSAPAAQSALVRDPQRAQNNVHPGNGNTQARPAAQPDPDEPENIQRMRRDVNELRVTLYRLARRLNSTPNSNIVQQVIYRLDLSERIKAPFRAGAQRSSYAVAAQDMAAEADSQNVPLTFEVSIMMLGMSGVGKSALINRLLGQNVAPESAFGEHNGNKIREYTGEFKGVGVKIIDTPGLESSSNATAHNLSVLKKIKAAHRKYKPTMVFYVDRMDVLRRQQGDFRTLQMVTEVVGSSVWLNTILVLTHAGEPVPEGPQGEFGYETWVSRRTNALQQSIRQAAGDPRLLNPSQMVDSSPRAPRNAAGEPLLPTGGPWRANLLLMAVASGLLNSAEEILQIQPAARSAQQQQAMAMLRGQRIPPVPYLVSQMVQPHKPKKPADDEVELKHPDQIRKLPYSQQKEEFRKRREYVKMRRDEAKAAEGQQGSVAVPGPETPLPPSFDGEPQSHRYRFLESNSGWLARPFVEAHGVDHDDNVDGFSIERVYTLRKPSQYLGGAPSTVIVQLHKDKNQFSLQSEADSSYWHKSFWVSSAGVGLQNIQSDMLYTGQLQTRLKFLGQKGPKTAVGVLLSRLSEGAEDKQSIPLPTKGPRAMGFKIEGKYRVHPTTKVVGALGRVRTTHTSSSEEALAANAELRLRQPGGDKQMLIGGSAMKFRRDLALGGNVSGQFSATKQTQIAPRLNYTNKGQGTVSVRITSHDQAKLGYSVAVPLVIGLLNRIRNRKDTGEDEMY
ncbi:hypothetical protein WJX74_002838 [Apatococcus lobatus]|uniref:AIG1-type G domain-containing protein n=1 Tax=Apatococcus lobatus TaxID=904363 RepID=A0AAW1RVK2_9CHLO